MDYLEPLLIYQLKDKNFIAYNNFREPETGIRLGVSVFYERISLP